VLLASTVKVLLLPATPAVLEPQTGQPGHQVQLGWPDVAQLDRL
jgi:hypothetical protein